MTVYLDSSVVLRLVLGQPDQLQRPAGAGLAIASELVRVECLRTLDRLRLRSKLPSDAVAAYSASLRRHLEALELVGLSPQIWERAGQPMPVGLGTLDAAHLASALWWREHSGEAVLMATHDHQLGLAARMFGLDVIGCGEL